MRLFDVRRIILDQISIDSIFYDPAISEIFYFKHNVEASNVIVFIGNPDVDIALATSSQFPLKAMPLLGYCIESFRCA